MNFSRILVPSIHEQRIARVDLDVVRIPDLFPWKLWKRLAVLLISTLARTEHVLLAVAGVPYPVGKQVASVEEDQDRLGPSISGWIAVGQVDSAMAVAERHTGHVPENKHESPFLIVHVPGRDDHLLALAARICVQKVCHEQESNFATDKAVQLVVARCGRQSGEEKNEPRESDFEKHLEVQPFKHARVELSTHEKVVDVVAGHAVLCATVQSGGVGDNANKEAGNDSHAHKWAELVNEGVELEEASEMEDAGHSDCKVKASDTIAIVAQLLASFMWQRLAS